MRTRCAAPGVLPFLAAGALPLVLVTLLACDTVREGGADLRVLFVGNSLTYTNDLPAMVAALADSAGGATIHAEAVAYPDVSLGDHLHTGDALETIEAGGWDVVVLQQGPSARPESRTQLVLYARQFAERIRAAGARPALFMVWPAAARPGDFEGVSASYRAAAAAVEGELFPVGEAWQAAWRREPALALYGPDGFHPSRLGTYAAAVVIYAGLTGRAPVGLPAALDVNGRRVNVPPSAAATVQAAAAEVLGHAATRPLRTR